MIDKQMGKITHTDSYILSSFSDVYVLVRTILATKFIYRCCTGLKPLVAIGRTMN